ncbi:MAG: S-layer family protein, partial [Cyanobacteria bacterium J06635_1]
IDASRGFLVAVPTENSDITANATVGDGGRVDVVAQGIFGIEARPELTPLSDITASSEFGAAGEVVLTRLILEPTDDLENVPTVAAIPRLAQGCETAAQGEGGRFVASGRGGVRTTPYGALGSSEFLGDVQLPRGWGSASTRSSVESAEDAISTDEIIEAQGWHLSEEGALTLAAVTTSESIGRCDRLSSDF